MKATSLSLLLTALQMAFCTNVSSQSVDEIASRYEDSLTNIVFQLNDAYVFKDWLYGFRKAEDYSPDAMLRALVSIAEGGRTSTNAESLRMARASINAMGCLRLTNALPMLRKWTLEGGDAGISSFFAYGEITGHDERYIELGQSAVEANTLTKTFFLGQLKMLLLPLDPAAMAYAGTHSQPLQEKSRLIMSRILINSEEGSFEDFCGRRRLFCSNLNGYTNSIEYVRAQRRINEFLIHRKENILKKSSYRFMGDNRKLSDDEWYRRATNSCQSEIARVMSLSEDERLNMTAILDAKIAAIEAAEARAARREVWKRRLRIGALALPIPLIALATIVVRRRRRTVSLPPICLRISDNAFGTREAEKGRNSPWASSSTPMR